MKKVGWAVVAALLVLAAVLLWPRPTTRYVVPAGELAAARDALETLAVKGRAPLTGYQREEFSDGWADLDGDGCSTRDDVLRRDLTDVRLDGCRVISGVLHDPYGGTTIAFDRADPEAVQIDHVVALADAWQKGAQQWTAQRRLEFANDPVNLLAVDGALNQAKGAGDAATWLPAASYRCAYAIRQVTVKARYGLWVTQAEHDALARQLDRCATAPSASAPSAGAAPLYREESAASRAW